MIGCGNVALDCARSTVRLGAKKVTCTCLESGASVPCHEWERREAEEEGIEILEGWAPQSFSGVHNRLESIDYRKVVRFDKENGKITFETDPDQAMELKADYVIVAIGQAANDMWKDYYDDEQIFFAGDVKDPVNSVVDAMASGKAAAIHIDEKFRGRRVKDENELRKFHLASALEKVFPAARLRITRPDMPILPVNDRIHNFDEVETAYSEAVINAETNRCLQCGYQSVDVSKCIGCGVSGSK